MLADFWPGSVPTSESKNSLLVVLGLTRTTAMPSATSSARIASVQPCIANLLAQYSLFSGTARWPRTLPILQITGV